MYIYIYIYINIYIFFSIWVFFHRHSRITGLQEKGEGILLTPHYHLHPLHRHFDERESRSIEIFDVFLDVELLLTS